MTDLLWEDLPTEWTPMTDMLGFLPEIIYSHIDAPAAEQITERYAHGGGYKPRPGFELVPGGLGDAKLSYRGDPDLREMARIYLPYSCELVILFEHSFVGIVSDEGELSVTRMD